ncbi:transaldolase, partial [Aureobasidium melanogenum]
MLTVLVLLLEALVGTAIVGLALVLSLLSICSHLANFAQEFWRNRVAQTNLLPTQTRIPQIPDQADFLERWYQFYNGYRTVIRPDGAEERVAVLGERFRDVSPGRLPRTLDELRAGQERSDADQRQHVEIATNNAPEGPSLEDALDQMFEEAEEEEQNVQRNMEQDRPPTLIHAPYTFNSNDTRSSHRVAGQVMRAAPPRNPEYQARRIAALRRELLRMRNGIERVISGLRDLGEPIPDHSDTTSRLSELGRSLDAMSVTPSSPNSHSANRETRAPVVGSVYRDPELTSVQQRFDEAQRQLEQAQRFRDQAAVEFQLAQASHTETSEILEGAELDLTEHREQVSQLRREQRTAENYARLFGTREDMETQGAEYESPIGGMFTRAYERFRVAEEVRQDERTLRQVLEHEQLATGPLFANNDDDNEEPHPAADTVYEDRLNEYYSMLRQQDWVQNIREPTPNNNATLVSSPSNVEVPDSSAGSQAEAVTSEQNPTPAAPQQMSTLERLLRNTPEPQRSSIIARMEQNGTAAAIRESESGNHLDVWRRLRDAYAPFRGNWEEGSESSDDEDRARGGLDAEDSGRPEPKEDADMTLKLDCKICYTQTADTACLPCGHLVMCQWCSAQHSPVMQHDRTRPRKPANCPWQEKEDMENQKTLLSELRLRSAIDCDTLDVEVAQALGPFVDCTSNQAIVNIELQKPKNEPLIIESIQQAKQLYPQYATEATFEQFASEVMAVNLSARMIPYLTGRALIQTNPYHAYSTAATIANAKRIIAIYKTVVPEFPSNRVCIKIPSTWEGIQACKVLEQEGIVTLATTLFSMEQAAAAHLAGCSYIAPYVNELPVHFVPGHVDNDKGFALTRSCQSLYTRLNSKTLVMPASLTSVEECLKVSGAHHITISPPLLASLASTPASASSSAHFFDEVVEGEDKNDTALLEAVTKEESYRIRYTRCKNGAAEKKLVDAINIFADCQDATEELVGSYVK